MFFLIRLHPQKQKLRLGMIARYDCFDSNCKFKNRDSSLDTYIKHLNDTHHINIRDIKMNPIDRDKYLPIRTI